MKKQLITIATMAVLFLSLFVAVSEAATKKMDIDNSVDTNEIVADLRGVDQSTVITLRGEITQNTRLTSNNRYLLDGVVFVRRGAKLRIQPGTQIFAGPRSALVIDRGAQIIAKGRANNPIIFTSAQDPGNRRRGDWGGIIINGFAPINNGDSNGEADGEGNTGKYGGRVPDDNSGTMRFCRVEFAGFAFSPTNELNGLALQGVGNKTVIENIQVTEAGDDAIEFFGGTVNVKRLLLFGSMDDAFDWTGGWVGKAQFVLIRQDGNIEANNGIEADNDAINNDLLPRSAPIIYNMTIVGDPDTRTATSIGMLLRVGTAGTLRNIIVQGYKDVAVRIKDDSTLAQYNSGALSLENIIFFDNRRGVTQFQRNDGSDAGDLSNRMRNILFTDPQLVDATSKNAPSFRPRPGSPAIDPANVAATPANDSFFERVNFVGGVGTTDATDFTVGGWVSFRRN
ncbi:MAG: hypothetical protein JNN15_14230 [Blastocatellia bacterium]|nr:hypothetical protein [Blastocatellia bacterium]